MFSRIVRHELQGLFADRIVWVAAGALILLSLYAAQTGGRAAEAHRAQVEAALAEETERYATLRETMVAVERGEVSPSPFQDPTRPYVAGRARGRRYAVQPPTPFQASAVGQSDLVPPVVPVILDGADPRGSREEIENPVHLMSGPLDLAFLVVFLLPILAIALTFDMMSREREAGTLALLLSQPVSARTVVLAKVVARWCLLLLIAVGAAAVGLLLFGGGLAVGPFLLWSVVVALYLAFWVGVAALLNTSDRSSARNAVALAFAWLIFAIVIPAATQISAGLLHPVPSRAELVALEREEVRQVQEEAAAVLARYFDDHPELLPEGSVDAVDFQTRAFAIDQEVQQRLAPVRERYRDRLAAQKGLIHALRWLSPSLLTYQALVDLAGTGDASIERFESQVALFHAEWVAFFTPKIYGNERLGPADLDRFPSWNIETSDTRAKRALVTPAAAGLLLFAGLALVGAVAGAPGAGTSGRVRGGTGEGALPAGPRAVNP